MRTSVKLPFRKDINAAAQSSTGAGECLQRDKESVTLPHSWSYLTGFAGDSCAKRCVLL